MKRWIWLVCVLLVGGTTLADDQAFPKTLPDAAKQVLAAIEAGDDDRVRVLANGNLDPWLVADELMKTAKFDEAVFYAKHNTHPDIAALQAYIDSKRDVERHHPKGIMDRINDALNDPNRYEEVLTVVEREKTTLVDDIITVRIEYAIALAHRDLKHLEDATAWFEAAGDRANSFGWLRRAAAGYHRGALTAYDRADFRGALRLWTSCKEVQRKRGNRKAVASLLGNLGITNETLGEIDKAMALQKQALKLKEELGDKAGAALTRGNIGSLYLGLGKWGDALQIFREAKAVYERLRLPVGIARMHTNIGVTFYRQGKYVEALEEHRKSKAIYEELGNEVGVAGELINIGNNHEALGDLEKALEAQLKALPINEKHQRRDRVATGLGNIGLAYYGKGEYAKALDYQSRALSMKEEIGAKASAGISMVNLGNIYNAMGEYKKSLEVQRRALKTFQELRDPRGIGAAWGNIGNVYEDLGQFAMAIECHEKSLVIDKEIGNLSGEAATHSGLGNAYHRMGQYERALKHHQLAFDINVKIKDKAAQAANLNNIANMHLRLGDPARAMKLQLEALARHRDVGNKAGEAATLTNIANIHHESGKYDEALEGYQKIRKVRQDLGDAMGAHDALFNASNSVYKMLDYEAALEMRKQVLEEATKLGGSDVMAKAHWALATSHYVLGRHSEADTHAREGLRYLETVLGGHDVKGGASLRDQWQGLYEIGVLSATVSGRTENASYYMENGRAGTLMEALGGRKSLRAVTVSDELLRAESLARAKAARALGAYREAQSTGALRAIRTQRVAHETALTELRDVVERIQRTEKAGAALAYPKADDLETIRGYLQPGDALVLYGLFEKQAMALVITPKLERLVWLASRELIEKAAQDVLLDEPPYVRPKAVQPLRTLVFDSLRLPKDVKRVLVSPSGRLGYVPFSLLLPEKVVAYVPSGTTYGHLLAQRDLRGEGVLALGDPDYGTIPDSSEVQMHGDRRKDRGGGLKVLPRLEGTRVEVNAIGTVKLLGKDATVPRLEGEIGKKKRWRSIHLACHGLVDREEPMFSSLVLSATKDRSGFLYAGDVLRMSAPSDLAVLSACETGRGKAYVAEGLIGLTRAFMHAGAPRVLVSLWKVDDKATQALMVKFYELWNPKEGQGKPPAVALREAQAFVKSHEEWSHPQYWAAWVLWGLPD